LIASIVISIRVWLIMAIWSLKIKIYKVQF